MDPEARIKIQRANAPLTDPYCITKDQAREWFKTKKINSGEITKNVIHIWNP